MSVMALADQNTPSPTVRVCVYVCRFDLHIMAML